MLTKISRIFGIAGGMLALFSILYNVISPEAFGEDWDTAVITIFIAAASFAANFFFSEKPVLAGVLMISSGVLLFPCFVETSYTLFSLRPMWFPFIPTLLLIAAGTLALANAGKASVSQPQSVTPCSSGNDHKRVYLVIKKLIRILGIAFAALNVLPWVYFIADYIYITCLAEVLDLYDPSYIIFPALLIAAAGLWGTLLLHKKPVQGAVMMITAGGLTLIVGSFAWWLIFSPLLLTAAGAKALICYKRTLVNKQPQNPDPAG